MKRVVKICLRVLAGLIVLLLLVFAAVSFYVSQHKQQFISFLTYETEKGLNGAALQVGDIHLGFKASFPLISLTIDSISLRDSLWSRHHHDLLSANRVFATIDFWDLIRGKIVIKRLDLDKPNIYFYTDSAGYSNTSVFKKRTGSRSESSANPFYPVLAISNARFTVDEDVKHKFFDFRIQSLICNFRKPASGVGLLMDLDLDCQIDAMAFNEEKGPFLKNKSVQGIFSILYDRDSRELSFEQIRLAIDHQPFVFSGRFFFAKEGTPFLLAWNTQNLPFRKAVSFLSENIQKKLQPYDIENNIDSLTGSLDNSETQYHTPLIHLWVKVNDRGVKTPFVNLDHASFIATYNNEAEKGMGHEDSNTVIHFSGLRGILENLDFKSDSLVLSNLIHPKINGNVVSDFDLNSVNGFLKESKLSFNGGRAKLKLAYAGSLDKNYDISRYLTGTIQVADADIVYQPKNYHFSPVSGILRFTGKDMSVDNLVFRIGKSDLAMNGKLKSIFYFINHLNEKYSVDWNIVSNRLYPEDFIHYFGKQNKTAGPAKNNSTPRQTISAYISKVASGDFNVHLNVNKLIYKKIVADSLQAGLSIQNDVVQCRNIGIQHLGISVNEGIKHKYFGFRVQHLDCDIRELPKSPVLVLDMNLNCRVEAMTFNPEKGPFLENKSIDGQFRLLFNRSSAELNFEKISMNVDQQPFVFTGKFFFAKEGTPFLLSWDTRNLSFRKAAAFLSANIQKTLERYDIEDPIAYLTGSLDNREPQFSTPLIHLWLQVENKNIRSPFIDVNQASFTATFNNEALRSLGHEDSNTVIHFSKFKGNWENLDFQADSVILNNLIVPRIKMNVVSEFKLDRVNSFLKENELTFRAGTGKVNLAYNGTLERHYDSTRLLTGTITLTDADLYYAPRNLRFNPVTGIIRFNGKDMFIDNLILHSGSSDLTMNGQLKSMFYFINQRNEKYSLDWNMKSNRLNLDDFSSFLSPQKKPEDEDVKKSAPDSTISAFVSQLTSSNYNISLQADQVIYKKFVVDSLRAAVVLKENSIQFKDVSLKHNQGSMFLNGFLQNDTSSNSFGLETHMSNINISNLFYAFDNFGLKSLTDKNISGSLSANINMQGKLTPEAQLIRDGFTSSIQFNLKDGQLLNFPPLVQIHQKFLKKRNLADVRFADLYDSIEVRGENITVNRMEIRSSVLTLFVNGMYNVKTGPDMSIQVPLSNLKANTDSVMVNKGIKKSPGISVRLRVRRGADGKLAISWDPFDKANKEIKQNENSAN